MALKFRYSVYVNNKHTLFVYSSDINVQIEIYKKRYNTDKIAAKKCKNKPIN